MAKQISAKDLKIINKTHFSLKHLGPDSNFQRKLWNLMMYTSYIRGKNIF